MKKSLLRIFVSCWLVLVGSIAGYGQPSSAPPSAATGLGAKTANELLWDEYGIPHIYGLDLLSVVRGYGYAQMENHAELILQKVAEARGRTAEYFGPGSQNTNVENDIRIRTYGIPERAAHWYRDGGFFQRLIVQAFVSGVNAYAEIFRIRSIPGSGRFCRSLRKMCSASRSTPSISLFCRRLPVCQTNSPPGKRIRTQPPSSRFLQKPALDRTAGR